MAKRTAVTGGLKTASVRDLRREIASRQRRAATFLRRRARLVDKLSRLDADLAELGVAAASVGAFSGGRKRFQNASTLADALASALDGKTLSITEAMQAVQKDGYRTTARNFRVMVSLALIRDKRFRRIERGRYTAR